MRTVLGIDVGGSTVKWVRLATRTGEVVARGTVPTAAHQPAIVSDLVAIARRAEADSIGIGVPGHVDRASGVTRFLPNLPGRWTDFPLGPTVAAATDRPVTVLNDARACCLAELRLGAARSVRDGLLLTLGTGVGGGVVSGGLLLVGPGDRLGEIGHLTYDRGGPRCGCGNRGCLETYASGPALVSGLRAAGGSAGTAADVFAAARAGDRVARAVVERAGRAIGETVASLCAVLPADTLVVGGGVAAGLPLLRPAIETALAGRRDFIGPVAVVPAALGTEAGAIGAALVADTEGMSGTTGGDHELDPARA